MCKRYHSESNTKAFNLAIHGDCTPKSSRKGGSLFCGLQRSSARLLCSTELLHQRMSKELTAKPTKWHLHNQQDCEFMFLEKTWDPRNTSIPWPKINLSSEKTRQKSNMQKPLQQSIGSSPDSLWNLILRKHLPPRPQKTLTSVSW